MLTQIAGIFAMSYVPTQYTQTLKHRASEHKRLESLQIVPTP